MRVKEQCLVLNTGTDSRSQHGGLEVEEIRITARALRNGQSLPSSFLLPERRTPRQLIVGSTLNAWCCSTARSHALSVLAEVPSLRLLD